MHCKQSFVYNFCSLKDTNEVKHTKYGISHRYMSWLKTPLFTPLRQSSDTKLSSQSALSSYALHLTKNTSAKSGEPATAS